MDGVQVSPTNNDNDIYNWTTNRKQCKFWQLQQMEQLYIGKLYMV
jgi:succinate dehydrogenase flavin-adding protein (antitoxin of CptAB toxin-antitoxin module)